MPLGCVVDRGNSALFHRQPAGEQDQEATLRLQGKSPVEQQEETSGGSGFKEGCRGPGGKDATTRNL